MAKLKLVTPGDENRLRRSEDGLFRPVQGDSLDADPNARVQGGALEMQMRMLQNGETNDKTAAQLLNMNG